MNNFVKGAAAGLLVGSAVALMTIPMTRKQSPRKRVSRALKSMGDLVEDIGCVFKG